MMHWVPQRLELVPGEAQERAEVVFIEAEKQQSHRRQRHGCGPHLEAVVLVAQD